MNVLIGKEAPDFALTAMEKGEILENFSLSSLRGKYVIFFFYPLDFTFVCPTELHAFQDNLKEFEKRHAQIVGCSVDSHFCHLAWWYTPRKKGGIAGVEYPIVSDINKEVSRSYGVLMEEKGIAFRGLFLIDREGIIRHQVINDLPLGRSIVEALRMLDALIFHEKHGEVCPANWKRGDKGMQTSSAGLEEYFKT